MAKDVQPAWTNRDSTLFETCAIVTDIAHGRLQSRPTLTHSFVLQFGAQEKLLASGGYGLYWFGSEGDGSYEKRHFIGFGSGLLGVATLGATSAISAIGNSRRKAQARAAAAADWRPVDQGALHISDHGIYLEGPVGFRAFNWSHITNCDLAGEGDWAFHANTTNGPAQFRLQSDWAELCMVLWAMARNQNHPRFVGGTWLSQGFLEKCRRMGYQPPGLSS